jgi:hypothetical protein
MPERLFRYVPCERAAAWEAAGWKVISRPVKLKPLPELVGRDAVSMMIVEWAQAGHPVEPVRLTERLKVPSVVE